ncbi:unnamed protein product [Allacma fusca]|uniref:Uncharacterized protein n=1 Tax=Allacma fusca TaxID=39272 RepID=A0A8J2KC23_9HEXA|nr:unnamed protein product [Allacma fusca]
MDLPQDHIPIRRRKDWMRSGALLGGIGKEAVQWPPWNKNSDSYEARGLKNQGREEERLTFKYIGDRSCSAGAGKLGIP